MEDSEVIEFVHDLNNNLTVVKWKLVKLREVLTQKKDAKNLEDALTALEDTISSMEKLRTKLT